MNLAARVHPFVWALLFITLNYCVLFALFERDKERFQNFKEDRYYHIVWCIIIPIGYWLLVPNAYLAADHLFSQLFDENAPLLAGRDFTYLAGIRSDRENFMASETISALTAIAAMVIVLMWSVIHRRSSKKELEYWWTTGTQFTVPGLFFLLMCALVVWSLFTFLVNVIFNEFLLLRIISHAMQINVGVTTVDSIGRLRAFQSYTEWVLWVWFGASLAMVILSYDRWKGGSAKGRVDYLLLLNFFVTVLVLSFVLVYPVFKLHGVLLGQQTKLGINSPNNSATPTWPVDSNIFWTIALYIPKISSIVTLMVEEVLGKKWERKGKKRRNLASKQIFMLAGKSFLELANWVGEIFKKGK